MGDDFAGDRIQVANGALSFVVTDVSLPGSNGLAVEFTRRYQVKNRKGTLTDEMLADWEVEIPSISGTFATDWVAGGAVPGNRCSVVGLPPRLPIPADSEGYQYSDYWGGLTIRLPDGSSQELLGANSDAVRPASGGPYPWVTEDGKTHVACLPALEGGGTGQGFIATMPNGTRIWFARMAQYELPSLVSRQVSLTGTRIVHIQPLRRNVLLATRVEDRFGNHVVYSYSNAWNQPARLTKITASDGRQLTLSYEDGRVASVSDGIRTWHYGYAILPDGGDLLRGRKSLRTVSLPDGSSWKIDFSQFSNAVMKVSSVSSQLEPSRSCVLQETPANWNEEPVGNVTHPSGSVASFRVGLREHGRSNVPVNCENVSFPAGNPGIPYGSNNDTNDDMNLYFISAYAFTLLQKRTRGPGVAEAAWDYSYSPGISFSLKNGATVFYPVCDYRKYTPMQCAAAPKCGNPAVLPCDGWSITKVVEPDGGWVKSYYGNSYKYNEGKLLRVERGVGDRVDVVETHEYDFSLEDKVYPAQFGSSLKVQEDGFSSGYHRPELKVVVRQQGRAFTKENVSFDSQARPVKITRTSAAQP